MPIPPTQTFIEVNGVFFPEIDTSQAAIDDVYYGADSSGILWIYRDDGVNPIDWYTPTTLENTINIPNYVNIKNNSLYIQSTNTLIPVLQDFRLINRNFTKIEYEGFSYYIGEVNKTYESDTITSTVGYDLLPNTFYLVTLN